MAGLELPTRAVFRLPATRPRRELDARPIGRARAARSAFSFCTALALVTFAAAGLTWLAEQPRWELQLPAGTVDLLDRLTRTSATATVAALGIGLVALAAWCVRAAGRAVRLAASRRRYA